MSRQSQNENEHNVTENTTLDEQLHAATSSIPNQFNLDNPLQKRSSDNPLTPKYRSRDKSTQEQICDCYEEMKSTLIILKECSKHPTYRDEFVDKYIKTMQKILSKQHNLIFQKDKDTIERFQKEIEGLKSNLSWLKVSKDTTVGELNKQILDLKEVHAREIYDRDNSLVFWQCKFDMKHKQWKNLQNNMIELNKVFNKKVTSMQGMIDEKDMELEKYSKNLDITSNNLRQESTHRKRLQEELKRIQKLVVTKENALDREREKFQESLSEKIKLLRDYNDTISLEYVALQAENQCVLQTIEINNKVKDETAKYEEKVDNFNDSCREESYLHIREMLVRILEKLDAVESQNNENIQTTINRKIP